MNECCVVFQHDAKDLWMCVRTLIFNDLADYRIHYTPVHVNGKVNNSHSVSKSEQCYAVERTCLIRQS